jgi:DNA-binding transcriptional LysR family regulator
MRNSTTSDASSGFDEIAAAHALLLVIQCRSFSIAAKSISKHPSTLSRTIAQLEQRVGAQLLRRTTRRVSVTEAGALYARHAEQLLAARSAAHDAIAELSGGIPRGHLRVTMPVSVGETLLAPHLKEFRRRFPQLRLELDLSDRNVPIVQGGFDLAIRVGKQPDSSLRAQLLGHVPILNVASKQFIKDMGQPSAPSELTRYECITISQSPGPVEWGFYHKDNKHRSEHVRIEGSITCTSPVLANKLACDGLGVVRIVEWVVRQQIASGKLVEVLPQWSSVRVSDGGLPVFVMYGHHAPFAAPLKTQVFVEMIKRIIEDSKVTHRRRR